MSPHQYHKDPPILVQSDLIQLFTPEEFGVDGGIYNPGAVEYGDKILLTPRLERWQYGDFGRDYRKFYSSWSCLSVQLNHDFRPISQKSISFTGFRNPVRLEDFRAFVYKGQVMLNHPAVRVSRVFRFFKNRLLMHSGKYWQPRQKQYISQLDVERGTAQSLGKVRLDTDTCRREKNWVFFARDNELYMIYSFQPYKIFKMTDFSRLRFQCHKILDKKFIETNYRVSLSSNPIIYDSAHYLLVVHTREPGPLYYQWAVLIDRDSLIPVKISKKPLMNGGCARGESPGVVYITASIILKDDVIFFLGEGDSSLSYAKIRKEILDGFFVTLP